MRRTSLLAAFLHGLGAPWWALPDCDLKRLSYYRSMRWRRKVRLVRRRAHGLCEWCASWGLEVPGRDCHHRTYKRLYHERLSDLVLLCWRHHARRHGHV